MGYILKPDLCIIGAGSGGLAAAAAARRLGASVVVVERERTGGLGLHAGGIPARMIAQAGWLARAMRDAARFGLAAREPRADIAAVHAQVRSTIASIAPVAARERLAALGIDVIDADAKFLDRNTVGAGETLIRARRFIIATGARPAVPAIPGLADVPVLTSETIFDLAETPTHLVVLGGTPVDVELAQAYGRLGVRVSLVAVGTILSDTDPELASIALSALREENVGLWQDTRVTEAVRNSEGALTLRLAGAESAQTIDASHVLVAGGRLPDIETLDLPRAGIRMDSRDTTRLLLNAHLLTSNRRVHAVGDAVGGIHATHAATHQAEIAVRHALLGTGPRYDATLVPRLVFTDPEIAEVGLTEPQARARLKSGYRVVRCSFAENDRARAIGEGRGLARIITDMSGRIVGAGIVGPQAGEIISVFALAVAKGLSARDLAAFIAPYPTLAGIAGQLGATYLHEEGPSLWQKRLAAFTRRLP